MLGSNKTFVAIVILGGIIGTLAYIAVNMPASDPGTDMSPASSTVSTTKTESETNETSPQSIDADLTAISDASDDSQAMTAGEESGVALTIEDLNDKQVGDPVSVFIPQEEYEYTGTIEEVEQNPSGSTSLVGSFPVDGSTYRFVFTTGEGYTFGTLHTPEGRYQYQALKGAAGRLVSALEINAKQDFSKPDYVIPEPVMTRKSDGR